MPSSEQLAAAAAARRPRSRKSALAGLQLDAGVHENSLGSRPARKAAGKYDTLPPACPKNTNPPQNNAHMLTRAAVARPTLPECARTLCCAVCGLLPTGKRSASTVATLNGQEEDGSGTRSGALVWLRQDLRVHDNPALCAAAKWAARGRGTVTLVYVHSPEEDGHSAATSSTADSSSGSSNGHWRPGGASLLWARAALCSLSSDLVSRYGAGAAIVYRHGPYAAALLEVC